MAVHAEPGDGALLGALRSGDEGAFARLLDSHHRSLLRVAQLDVQDRFEERSSRKTWIDRILTNRANTRAQREHRQLPFSALISDAESELAETRFRPIDDPKFRNSGPRRLAQLRTTIRTTGTPTKESLAPEARDELLAAFRTSKHERQ